MFPFAHKQHPNAYNNLSIGSSDHRTKLVSNSTHITKSGDFPQNAMHVTSIIGSSKPELCQFAFNQSTQMIGGNGNGRQWISSLDDGVPVTCESTSDMSRACLPTGTKAVKCETELNANQFGSFYIAVPTSIKEENIDNEQYSQMSCQGNHSTDPDRHTAKYGYVTSSFWANPNDRTLI